MRLTLPARAQSKPLSTGQRRAWLALWAQGRRRARIAASAPEPEPEPSGLLAGLVGYFNLDEAGDYDDAVDAAGGIGALLVTNTLVPAAVGPGLHGARDFAGGGSLQVENFAAITDAPLTLNFWVKQNSDGGQYPFDCRGNSGYGLAIFLATDGMFVDFGVYDPDYHGTNPVFGEWYAGDWMMFTFVWAEDSYEIYHNGALIGDGSHVAGAFGAANQTFTLSSPGLPLNGAMALAGLWDRALSGAEVAQLFNGGDGLGYAELT